MGGEDCRTKSSSLMSTASIGALAPDGSYLVLSMILGLRETLSPQAAASRNPVNPSDMTIPTTGSPPLTQTTTTQSLTNSPKPQE